jgi:hypothetical protein
MTDQSVIYTRDRDVCKGAARRRRRGRVSPRPRHDPCRTANPRKTTLRIRAATLNAGTCRGAMVSSVRPSDNPAIAMHLPSLPCPADGNPWRSAREAAQFPLDAGKTAQLVQPRQASGGGWVAAPLPEGQHLLVASADFRGTAALIHRRPCGQAPQRQHGMRAPGSKGADIRGDAQDATPGGPCASHEPPRSVAACASVATCSKITAKRCPLWPMAWQISDDQAMAQEDPCKRRFGRSASTANAD